MTEATTTVPGRACGTCMMCCKLTSIVELNKPAGKWCQHAVPGKGCAIYDQRPAPCRAFVCGWMEDASLGPEWKPEISKFMVFVAGDGAMTVMVDPGSPAAWKDPRYYPAIKTTATRLLERNMPTMVVVGSKRFVVLPDRNVEVTIPPGYGARVVTTHGPGGDTYDVEVAPLSRP